MHPINCSLATSSPVNGFSTVRLETVNAQITTDVTLHLSNPSEFAAGVNFHTVDQTAVAGREFVAASGDVTFAPLQTTASISITILGDEVLEGNEAFLLVLHHNLWADLSDSVVTGTILDND